MYATNKHYRLGSVTQVFVLCSLRLHLFFKKFKYSKQKTEDLIVFFLKPQKWFVPLGLQKTSLGLQFSLKSLL